MSYYQESAPFAEDSLAGRFLCGGAPIWDMLYIGLGVATMAGVFSFGSNKKTHGLLGLPNELGIIGIGIGGAGLAAKLVFKWCGKVEFPGL